VIETEIRKVNRGLTFEHILHGVEELLTYSFFLGPGREEPERPLLSLITQPAGILQGGDFELPVIVALRRIIVEALLREVGSASIDSAAWPLRQILDELHKVSNVDCITLNYDGLIDSVFTEIAGQTGWTDGFSDMEPGPSFIRFLPEVFAGAFSRIDGGLHRVCHIHGHVLFGLAPASFKVTTYRGAQLEVVKYASKVHALSSLAKLPLNTTPSRAGDLFQPSPIISGLRKLERLQDTPFNYYYQTLVQALTGDQPLVLIGYGGEDDHINFWLRERQLRQMMAKTLEITNNPDPQQWVSNRVMNLRVKRLPLERMTGTAGPGDGVLVNYHGLVLGEDLPIRDYLEYLGVYDRGRWERQWTLLHTPKEECSCSMCDRLRTRPPIPRSSLPDRS
jgi:hypothetical protein